MAAVPHVWVNDALVVSIRNGTKSERSIIGVSVRRFTASLEAECEAECDRRVQRTFLSGVLADSYSRINHATFGRGWCKIKSFSFEQW